MPWPDIFFKSRKPKPESGTPPPLESTAGNPKPPALPTGQPPTIKPVPVAAVPQAIPTVLPQIKFTDTGTRTIPAMHGVILRPPTRLNVTTQISPGFSPPPPEPIKNIEQLMAEADPVRTLSQTGGVRMLKRQPEPMPVTASNAPTVPLPQVVPTEPSSIKPDPALPGTSASTTLAPDPVTAPLPPLASVTPEKRPMAIPAPSPFSTTRSIRGPRAGDTPFILKPNVSLTSQQTRKLGPPNPPAMIPLVVARRKTNMADIARLVLPPKREEPETTPLPPVPGPMVVPPSFTVTSAPSRPITEEIPNVTQPPLGPITTAASALENPFLEKTEPKPVIDEIKTDAPVPQEKQAEMASLFVEPPKVDPEAHKPAPTGNLFVEPQPQLDPEAHKESPFLAPESPKPFEPTAAIVEPPAPLPPIVTENLPATTSLFVEPPKVDSEAHKPEPTIIPAPQLDPEAHKEPPVPAPEPPKAVEPEKPAESTTTVVDEPTPGPSKELGPAKEKREFHLTNGEKVAGVVLSETPEAVYIEHGTLGVVTIPRNEIAKRLVEIILINGDRIVGDIMAETADMIYVRHASLGMLSVPRAQRSTRVVEAILNDGDRILGEILTETDTFTVIKSATLGTVTVPHDKIAMLNRKIEQIELKALPMSAPMPELKDKS